MDDVAAAIKAALEGFEESQYLSTLRSSTRESTKDIFQTFSLEIRQTVSCVADHGIVRVALARERALIRFRLRQSILAKPLERALL